MPETYLDTVRAAQLKVGDSTRGIGGGTVRRVDVKVKFVYVDLGSSRPLRLPVDQLVKVSRTRPTAEEREADKRAYMMRMLDRAERSADENLKIAQDKVKADMDAGYQLSWSRLGELLAAQAAQQLWARVAQLSRIQAERAVDYDVESGTWSVRPDDDVAAEQDGTPAMDRLAVLEYMKEKVRGELLDWSSFTSRSTSSASNLIEDYSREAKAKFVSGRLHYGL